MDPRISLAKMRLDKVGVVILFGSGKGGVGKSLISAAVAHTLSSRGHETAYLDLDIHGPTAPLLFPANPPIRGGREGLIPPVSHGVKVMSVGLFLSENPLPLSGRDKPELVLDLLSAVEWGRLNYLVVDLPPGMGDELVLTRRICGEKARLVLLTTNSSLALNVVKRLRRYAEAEKLKTLGVIVNMLGLFKEEEKIAESLGLRLLGTISFYPELERFQSIKEKLESVEGFRREVENAAENLVRVINE